MGQLLGSKVIKQDGDTREAVLSFICVHLLLFVCSRRLMGFDRASGMECSKKESCIITVKTNGPIIQVTGHLV